MTATYGFLRINMMIACKAPYLQKTVTAVTSVICNGSNRSNGLLKDICPSPF
jgi:hypothetical protein